MPEARPIRQQRDTLITPASRKDPVLIPQGLIDYKCAFADSASGEGR